MNITIMDFKDYREQSTEVAFLHVDCNEDQGNFSNQLATLVDSETNEELYWWGKT